MVFFFMKSDPGKNMDTKHKLSQLYNPSTLFSGKVTQERTWGTTNQINEPTDPLSINPVPPVPKLTV